MCQLSWNLGASTSWNPQGLSRPVMGLLYIYGNRVSDVCFTENVLFHPDNREVPPAVYSNDNHVLWHNWSAVNRYGRPATESQRRVTVLYFATGLQGALLSGKYESTSRQWDKHCFRKIICLWATVIYPSVYFVFICYSLTWSGQCEKTNEK